MRQGTVSDKLARFLYSYKNTPHSTTGTSPTEPLLGRRLQSRFDLMKPSLETHIAEGQAQQKYTHDLCAQAHTISVNTPVYVRSFGQGDMWIPGVITAKLKALSYKLKCKWEKATTTPGSSSQSHRHTSPSFLSSSTWTDSVQSSCDSSMSQVVNSPDPSSTRRYPLRDCPINHEICPNFQRKLPTKLLVFLAVLLVVDLTQV